MVCALIVCRYELVKVLLVFKFGSRVCLYLLKTRFAGVLRLFFLIAAKFSTNCTCDYMLLLEFETVVIDRITPDSIFHSLLKSK